jgi:ATP-dependent helicase Lhr and Lhr-like helicase
MLLKKTTGYTIISAWLKQNDRRPFLFQEQAWQSIISGESGLVNAPTGCGKTYAVFLGAIIQYINNNPTTYTTNKNNGLQMLWITPLKALAKDIGRAMQEACNELLLPWKVGIRNGDTPTSEREKQKRNMPEILIITPESLHLLLGQKNNDAYFKSVKIIAVDEWHELLGGKRGVLVELAIARIVHTNYKTQNTICSIWGISATIGNLEEAKEVLVSTLKNIDTKETRIIKANMDKKIEVESIYPDEIEKYPWAGHLGIKLVDKIIPIIQNSKTTLVFINTRGMTEMWYQSILNAAPELAGAIALHHGSIEQELRLWVEDNLHLGTLKAVVCRF